MSIESGDGWKLEAINPINGLLYNLAVPYGKKEAIKRHGVGRARELIEVVPGVVRYPRAVFRGVRNRWQKQGLCYVGLPDRAYDVNTGNRIPPWEGKVFLVFANQYLVVYTWRWEVADAALSHLPEGYKTRFSKKLL
jgi:hypothetical protein